MNSLLRETIPKELEPLLFSAEKLDIVSLSIACTIFCSVLSEKIANERIKK